jgi:thymidylate synthase ThyX
MFELTKRIYDLETKREVNDKAKEIFEEAIQGGPSRMRGRSRTPAVIEFKDLVKVGVPSKVRTKLGMAGVDVNSLLKSISGKTEEEAIDELRQSAENLAEEEARQLWKTAVKMMKRQT